jgi:hypothetical protein
MNIKIIIAVILLGFVGFSLVYLVISENDSPVEAIPEIINDDKVIAYYFHGHKRCTTCLEIESLAGESIETGFPEELLKGNLVMETINFEESSNAHYAKEFELIYSSLVIVEYRDGEQVRWKNLEKVWDYVWQKDDFIYYVQNEINEFLYAQDSFISKLDN